MNKLWFILLILGTLLASCNKTESVSVSVETINVSEGASLRNIFFINDSVAITCGGTRKNEGYIYKTYDGGLTWSEVFNSNSKCLYTVSFINDSIGFVGGDNLYLLVTNDAGENWAPFAYGINELPYHEQNRPAIKDIKFNDANIGYFVGGENYNKGVIYKTINGGTNWSFDTLHQEIKCISIGTQYTWASGFGYIGQAETGYNISQLELTNDVFVAISELENNSIVTVSTSGKIYISKDQGSNWNKISNKESGSANKSHLLDMETYQNKGVIISENKIYISNDYCETWRKTDYSTTTYLTSISFFNGQFYITNESGDIVKFSF